MKIAVIGGGPAGLYFAMLVRKRQPAWSVTVVEQNPPDATFGFGVVMASSGRNSLHAADAESHDALIAKMAFTDRQVITVKETPLVIERPDKGGAIRRIDLLEVLQASALQAGVEIRSGVRLASLADLEDLGLGDADLIVGADGVNSMVRHEDEAGFGTHRSHLTNHFAWFGVGKAFPSPALVFRQYEGGSFVAHYYPYAADRSTFVAECDDATWHRFGMEELSPDHRAALFEKVFAAELDGFPLLSNNSAWRQFPVIRNARWHSGNKVLIGDAQTSAHFSIGSGTRIAMEDAIALAQAVGEADGTIRQALHAFEQKRRPEKEKLISASERSYLWYEEVGNWLRQYTPHQFVYHFMTRTGRVNDQRLAAAYPALYAALQTSGATARHGAQP
ncbi:FAD-dependent monooxygenase [Bordetella genomosp. 12]|uniref:Monooxygenase n=1 Tax=Bordetella genomosp. 12 TaxID=463035 RepID=A0A261VD11_9BORD|nr:FAD-dependent monooxygenase [Bordetella genomosp. 12]OZI71989.1 monooxygenase [Bordetella genomosp. 12]